MHRLAGNAVRLGRFGPNPSASLVRPSAGYPRFCGSALLNLRDPAARPAYKPRRAAHGLLLRIVRANLEAFLAHVRESYEAPLPAYVEKELRAFIACGDSMHGFAVARCEACQKRLLVPLSCKRRGICGSCIARRMCDAAAHLVDHVFPSDVPVRQWVISAPF